MKKIFGFALILLSIIMAVHTYSLSSVTNSLSVAVVDSSDALLAYETMPVTLIAGDVLTETTPIVLANRLPETAELLSIDIVGTPDLVARSFTPNTVPASDETMVHVLYEGVVTGGTYPVRHLLTAETDDVRVELTIDVPFYVRNRLDVTAQPADGGTVTGAGIYDHGSIVPVEAIPNRCYTFDGWAGDVPAGHEFDSTIDVELDSNKQLVALFAEQRYLLAVDASDGGSVKTKGDNWYKCGERVTLHAVSDDGYDFVGWSGGLDGTDNPATITMNADVHVEAEFEPAPDTPAEPDPDGLR